MSSGLTLGFARANLPTAALTAQKAASATLAAPDINAAVSWIMSHGKWRGTIQRAVFSIYDEEQVTLPRSMVTVEAAVLQGTGDQYRMWQPFNVVNEWFQWIPGGAGFISNAPYNTVAFTSLGDGFVIFRDLPSTGVIKVYNVTTESAGTINIRGFDSNGDKVYTGIGAARIEGEALAMPTTSGTSSTTSTTWNSGNSLYAIVKPTTNGILKFYQVASDLTETLIGQYDPGETNPNYRRYLVPKGYINSGQVVGICKVRHVPVVVDNDQILPGNLQALEMALMALNFRRKAEMDRALQYIEMATDQLNSEIEEFNAEQSWGTMQIDPSVGMGSQYNLV